VALDDFLEIFSPETHEEIEHSHALPLLDAKTPDNLSRTLCPIAS